MKSILFSAAIAVMALAGQTATASADWWNQVIADTKKQSGQASAPARKSATKSAATQASSSDDGSRPQRRAASAPQPSGSLSGGETGVASYYWQPQRLAGGGWFDPNAWTAAHKTLPLGTRVRVTRLDNGNTVDVTINDRGPYISGRIIDLSRRAAQAIAMTGQGVARVRVNILGR